MMALVNAVAEIAHQENHHPNLQVGFNTCEVRFTTRSCQGLSQNDFICAAKIDRLGPLSEGAGTQKTEKARAAHYGIMAGRHKRPLAACRPVGRRGTDGSYSAGGAESADPTASRGL